MTESSLPLDLTDEEKAFGFGVTELGSGVVAVVSDLGTGLRALKVYGPDGATGYAICDGALQPLYHVAESVEELRRRFPRDTDR